MYFSQKLNVYEPENKSAAEVKISKDRQIFGVCYKQIMNFAGLKANDIIDLAGKLSIKDSANSPAQYLLCLIVFMELNFIEFDEILNNIKILKAKKMELSSSVIYNAVEWLWQVMIKNLFQV